MLSVVAQQISSIQRAIATKTVKLLFEETTLKLDPTCNIFVTMNSEYCAGNLIANGNRASDIVHPFV